MLDMDDRIASWVSSLPEYVAKATDTPLITAKKRKRLPPLSSPPASVEGKMASTASTPKKRRRKSPVDPDSTPRPGFSGGSLHRTISASSTTSTSQRSHVSSSRASSPRKQMLNLRLYEPFLEFGSLDVSNVDALPSAAGDLVRAITKIQNKVGILPDAVKSITMESVNAREKMPEFWQSAFKPAADDDTDALLPGRIPSYQEVERIRRKAAECDVYQHEEVSWNCNVHARLLELILEDEEGRPCDEFGAMICTTARIHPAWKPTWSPGKMIDICLYHTSKFPDGHDDKDLQAKITQFSCLNPTRTVNHTDFFPMGTRPIVLSIETKKPGADWEEAKIQIGVWHAAQWAFLRWAVADKLRRQFINNNDEEGGEGEADEDVLVAEVSSIMSKLGFIPGVIVQGHQWHLILSTYEDRKTKIWSSCQFGSTFSTSGCIELYSAIAGMRRLTAWAKDVYMPWFKSQVLDYD
ncbi:hypothetical protein F5Y17DRAFT_441367 [Xylariaceae sp. FL0594]|nr:hypothetical protein F5Y17DRAFT_441367 [Xylariaceae sp. FL0594]